MAGDADHPTPPPEAPLSIAPRDAPRGGNADLAAAESQRALSIAPRDATRGGVNVPAPPGQRGRASPLPDDAPVPKLPRGRGIRLSRPQLVRIAGTVFLLVFLVVVQRPCANAVSTFVTGFGSAGDRGSAAALMPRPGTVDVPPGAAAAGGSAGAAPVRSGSGSAAGPGTLDLDQYEHLRPGMTDEEVKAVIERARRKAAGGSAVP